MYPIKCPWLSMCHLLKGLMLKNVLALIHSNERDSSYASDFSMLTGNKKLLYLES